MDDKGSSKGVVANSSKDPVNILNSILQLSSRRQVSQNQIMIILDALAGAQDPALVSRFPAVLALCARRGIELSSQHLLGRYWESNPKRQNLERLLFTSAELFRREGIPAPRNLAQIAESLRVRYAGLSSAAEVRLAGGPVVAVADMRSSLQQFSGTVGEALREPDKPAAAEVRRSEPAHLPNLLDLLFSEKQKELVLKKLRGQHLTKTEREYYSRVVKKKLAAIADSKMQELAASLCSTVRRTPSRKARGGNRILP